MKQLTFLLIDDDQDDHFIFANALDLAFPDSYCSYTFNCPEAVELLNRNSMVVPDFIFMDWSMPYMNAIECIRALKEIEEIAETPMYILSSSKPSFEIEHVVGLHIKKVLQKQVSIQQLASEIKGAVGGY